MTREHTLKTAPSFFSEILGGRKTFEARYNRDRDFAVGDRVCWREWDPSKFLPTGSELHGIITYVLPGGRFGIDPNHCVFSFELDA